jgi:hypothetical protein
MAKARDRDAGSDARPEVLLLLCCARTQTNAEMKARVRLLLRQTLDWDYLLQASLSHRVMPLLYQQLRTNFSDLVPAEFMERLQEHFYLNAARNHLFTNELCEILELFEKEGVRAVAYKGPALAAGIYGDVALRQFNDLDIFIRRSDVEKASELLHQRGYRKDRELTSADEAAFRKVECEHMFRRDEGQFFLDLHWGLAPAYFPLRLDLESMWQRLEPISIGETRALSFAPEDLLLILCVNGGKELWERLSGLCDINELLRAYPDVDWETLISRASRAHARRMMFTSLLLAQDLLGLIIPETLRRSIAKDNAPHLLALQVKRALFQERTSESSVSQFLKPAKALDGLRDRARFHWRLALTPTPEDWTFINLSERFRFLYYLTRPVRLAKKYLLRLRQ